MSRWTPGAVAALAGVFLAGVVVGAPVSDAAYDYTWRDPDFCDDCHVHDYANERYWQSRHAGVTTCHDCHMVPIAHYPRNLWKLATVTYDDPSDVHTPHVPTVVCAACHLEGHEHELTGPMTPALLGSVPKVDRTPLHDLHLALEHDGAPVECLACHGSGGGSVAHRFTSSRDRCVACHGPISPSEGDLARMECRDCHLAGFVVGGRAP